MARVIENGKRTGSGKDRVQKEAPAHDHSIVLTADGQINISQSKVKSWLTCRRQFHNKFVLGLQRKKVKRPFMFGGIVHTICETEAEGEDWRVVLDGIELEKGAMFRREREMYGNIIQDIRFIMEDYFEYYDEGHPNYMKPIKHGGRRSEHEFRIELEKGIWFTGRVDMVTKSRKMRWLTEHKTFSRMPSEDERWRSIQAAVYFRALDIIGMERIDGVLWDYVSSKPLNVPGELTPTGKISQKQIDSLPSRVRAWIKEEGHKKKDFAKLLADAEANRRNRFIRLYSPVKRPVVKMIWEDFNDTAREIADFFGKKKAQNIGRHCTWCDYQALCKAEMTGSDVDWLIEREFQQEDLSHKRDENDRSED